MSEHMSEQRSDAAETARFAFVDANPAQPGTSLLPFLPLTLSHDGRTVAASGLLDTGATTNVLPYSLGEQLGLVWERQRVPLVLIRESGACAGAGRRGFRDGCALSRAGPPGFCLDTSG